jgi:hypothetical protein
VRSSSHTSAGSLGRPASRLGMPPSRGPIGAPLSLRTRGWGERYPSIKTQLPCRLSRAACRRPRCKRRRADGWRTKRREAPEALRLGSSLCLQDCVRLADTDPQPQEDGRASCRQRSNPAHVAT